MNRTRFFVIVGIGVVLALLAAAQAVNASQPFNSNGGSNPADNPWFLQTVEAVSGAKVGQYTSIAIHPMNGKPYISHYDATHQDLLLSYPVETNGNCGTNNSWHCQVIDSAGDVGQYSSIDTYYDSGTNTYKMGIAYFDATNAALKVAIWSCPTLVICGWNISTIEQGFSGIASYGEFSSIKFDSTGSPHISYNYWNTVMGDQLMYAHYVGSGGDCGVGSASGKWECSQVNSGYEAGLYTSLDLTSTDKPMIANYTNSPGILRLCSLETTWECRTIDYVGFAFPSLAIDQNNHAHIAYYSYADGKLKYANYVGSGGNCGINATTSQSEYQCDSIDSIGTGLTRVGLSLAIDPSGHAIIAYQNSSDPLGFPTLDIARPMVAYAGKIAGNCGPTVGIVPQWQCDTLDNATEGGGGGYLYEAEYTSVTIEPTGLAYISYYEYDDYYEVGRLKLAYQLRMEEVYLPLVIK